MALNEETNAPQKRQSEEFDYSVVRSCARIAIYDDLKSAPRIKTVDPDTTLEFIQNLAVAIYNEAKNLGGSISYTNVLEVTENFIHAQFTDIVVSILDGGNTIRFADKGPGIRDKDKVQLPGFSSATEPMKKYIRGVGSGLPLVKDYIDTMGGYITIEDNIDNGAVVTISLTKKKEEAPVEVKDEAASLDDRSKTIISIIDENRELGTSEVSALTGIPLSSVNLCFTKLEKSGILAKQPNKKRQLTPKGKTIASVL